MKKRLARLTIVVDDYDKAIAFYCNVLNFRLIEDTQLTTTKRWVVISPDEEDDGCSLLIAQPKNKIEASRIGNQTGGRVFLFLFVESASEYLKLLVDKKVKIVRPLEEHSYGIVFVFSDIFGNLWDVIEPKNS